MHASQKQFDFRKMKELNLELANATGPRVLTAPRAVEHLKAMSMYKKMNVLDQAAFREAVSLFGDSKNFRWIGSAPLSVWALTLDLYPDLFQDQKEFRKWLKQNEYDAPAVPSQFTQSAIRVAPGQTTTTESKSLVLP